MSRRNLGTLLNVALISALVLALVACGATPTPTAVPTKVAPTVAAATQVPATQAPPTATQVRPTATVVPPTPTQAPTVGGTLVLALPGDPDTLDAQNTVLGNSLEVLSFLGASLLSRDKDGKYYGYLAESWTTSADGLTWTFKLKKGVKFHDGSPLTAKDWVWTFQRGTDPKLNWSSFLRGMIDSAEAPDDYTLVVKAKKPMFSFTMSLADASGSQPLSQAEVQKWGDQYGHNPVGVGPYVFKGWQTGGKIVLERNPDYNWGPAFHHQGPAYIQTIQFPIIAEAATIAAGLESGELDGIGTGQGQLAASDVPRVKATNKFQIFEATYQGLKPALLMNVSRSPFDDAKVRQAFNYAADKQTMIKVDVQGNGVPQYGPLSSTQGGYWPGVEQIGYKYDLAKAKQLMNEAGYVAGADGMLSKDGKPFSLVLKFAPKFAGTAQLLQEQYKALGVDIKLQQEELGTVFTDGVKGNYELCMFSIGSSDADFLYNIFDSSQLGAADIPQVNIPELDKLVEALHTTMDPDKRQLAVNAAVTYIVQNALLIPIYSPTTFYPLSNRVKGGVFSQLTGMDLSDAYIVAK